MYRVRRFVAACGDPKASDEMAPSAHTTDDSAFGRLERGLAAAD
jgi:hypothetical protein